MKLIQRIRERRRKRRLARLKSVPMTFGEYCLLYDCNAIKNHEEMVEKSPKPTTLCGRYMPKDLDNMTMGTLVKVMNDRDDIKMLNAIYNVSQSELQTEWAQNVIGAVRWTTEQLERITELFKSLERDYTTDEILAGFDKRKKDIFATIDWYALRMGITDHDLVLKVPWIVIWKCADEDRKDREYQEAINEIRNKKR